MSFPRATVRLQLHRGFTFDQAAAAVDYYAALGISHFYLSPVFAAREGSTHGYDVMDPARINPELGGMEGLVRLVQRLRDAGMGAVIDIVPNHMGIASAANPYWQDILLWGPASPHAHWFDIDWDAAQAHLKGKVLLPVLGEPYSDMLSSGKLALHLEPALGRLSVRCYERLLPLNGAGCAAVLRGQPLLAEAAQAFAAARPGDSWQEAQRGLAALAATGQGQRAMDAVLLPYQAEQAGSAAALHELLEQQHYRLSWWRNAAEEINWRRFFEVSDLAGVRVELDDVFEATHALVFRLYAEGLIDGVRVDHVDGLADPAAYCRRLRSRLSSLQALRPAALAAEPAWIVVEKILSPGEDLPADWQVDGSTGYDFMDQVGAVLHDGAGEQILRALWKDLTGDPLGFDAHVQAARQQMVAAHFAGEAEALALAVQGYAQSLPPLGRTLALPPLRRVLAALLVSFRRYRCYVTVAGSSVEDQQMLGQAMEQARSLLHLPDHALLEQVANWLGAAPLPHDEPMPAALLAKAQTRFQQLTPPLAAKAGEDTAFYRYGPLLSRNEVGSYPASVSSGVQAFHASNRMRAEKFPAGLLATATHDHKRGEDSRARLAVLSEIPQDWAQLLRDWMQAHGHLRSTLVRPGGQTLVAPTAADEWMLYQSLLGAWPADMDADDEDRLAAFVGRVAAWQLKALREAKKHTGWLVQDPAYEAACQAFLEGLFSDEMRPGFVRRLAAFVQDLAPAAAANSLTQTLLRLTCPGIPDLYQGTEFADFSLVDPDNRRPVDMLARRSAMALSHADAATEAPGRLQAAKQTLVRRVLQLRRAHPALFCGGDYLPLEVAGDVGSHVLVFARRDGNTWAISAGLRHPAAWYADGMREKAEWRDAVISLPGDFPRDWQEVLSGRPLQAGNGTLMLGELFEGATLALLLARPFRKSVAD